MIPRLLDDLEEKLDSFTLILFKTLCFFLGENSTSLPTRSIQIKKPQSTKYGVASIDVCCMFAMNLALYVGEIDFAVADHD